MVISFYGESCFKIQSGDLTILTDPFDQKTGLSLPRFKHDAVIKTISSFPPEKIITSEVQLLGPGEYNFSDVNARGFFLEKESSQNFIKTIYSLEIEGVRILLFGHLSDLPDPSIMERIGDVDILFIPAGGKPFIDQKSAKKIIKQIQPKMVIPTLYKIPGLKRQAEDLKIFLEEVNHGKTAPQEKLTIKKKDLAGIKPSQIVVLKI